MIANAVADTYVKDQVNAKANLVATQRLGYKTDWVISAIKHWSRSAPSPTIRLSTTSFRAGEIVSTNSRSLISTCGLGRLAQELRTLLAQLNRYKSVLHADTEGSPAVEALVAGSDALNNPIINNLRQQYLEVGRRKSEYSERFGRNHLAVIDLQRRMQNLRASMLDEVRRLAETIQSDYLVAKQRQQEIEKQLDAAVSLYRSANSDEVARGELESWARTHRSLHDTVLASLHGRSSTRIVSNLRSPPNLPSAAARRQEQAQDDANSSVGNLRRDRCWDRSRPVSALDRSGLPNFRPCRSGP